MNLRSLHTLVHLFGIAIFTRIGAEVSSVGLWFSFGVFVLAVVYSGYLHHVDETP